VKRLSGIARRLWRASEMSSLPLTLTLSPKGRGKLCWINKVANDPHAL
jgi:hypothetical protein